MKLNDFMELHSISVTTMAEATGLSLPTISSYLEGRRSPSVDNAFNIEKVTLGIVKASDFITGNVRKKPGRKKRSLKKKKATIKQPS